MKLLARLLVISVFTIGGGRAQEVTPPSAIKTLPGFRVELIHAVDRKAEGSWVALTVDPRGRIIAADQYGGLFRVTPPPAGHGAAAQVEKLMADISGVHGLLYAFDSLYVLVNEKPSIAGLYRLRDTKGTGEFDEKTLLREIQGQGEHGVHSLTLAPDGRSLYIACGNDTASPGFQHTRAAGPLGEDLAVPRINRGANFSDARPHAFTAKVSPDGSRFELIAAGMRNHFDLAFNALGDLFTYDSDMEWDAGTPWYRPTRIYQVLSGGDYGFRESSGKLQGYCGDIVPPLCEVGPGSPTGMTSGLGAAFPAKYQHAIYACDWTYGTLYAVHLLPQGAGYTAELEEFVSAKPLPLTDVVIGKDGALYFAIGGRRVQSALYRVSYHGPETTASAPLPAETPEHRLRVELEKLHEEGSGPEAVEKAWPHLGHPDRLVRHAARVAIERQPVQLWATRAVPNTDPWAVIETAIALARRGGKDHHAMLLGRLNDVEFSKLDTAQQLALVRAYQVSLARGGMPVEEVRAATEARLEMLYPAKANDLNRELAVALVALDSPAVVAKTVALLKVARDEPVAWLSEELLARNDSYGANFLRTGPARPNVQQIAYVHTLRHARSGWTPELRREYFAWFLTTRQWQGGNQFRGFLEQIRADALANVADAEERKGLDDLSKLKSLDANPVPIRPPRGPGKQYTAEDLPTFTADALKNRDFTRGRELYIAAACQACHRVGNDGGGVGPDLTGAANRYTLRDLLENIIEPSKVISNQYESTILELKSGHTIVGRVSAEEDGILQVVTDPSAPNRTIDVQKSDVENRQVSPVSLMPLGLIDSMNRNEVLDLAAYILSGGQRSHPMFKK